MVKPIVATDERYSMPIRALRNVRAALAKEPAKNPHGCLNPARSEHAFKYAVLP
jgi:hypothetical protein